MCDRCLFHIQVIYGVIEFYEKFRHPKMIMQKNKNVQRRNNEDKVRTRALLRISGSISEARFQFRSALAHQRSWGGESADFLRSTEFHFSGRWQWLLFAWTLKHMARQLLLSERKQHFLQVMWCLLSIFEDRLFAAEAGRLGKLRCIISARFRVSKAFFRHRAWWDFYEHLKSNNPVIIFEICVVQCFQSSRW